jgi:ankyrin repeat protein
MQKLTMTFNAILLASVLFGVISMYSMEKEQPSSEISAENLRKKHIHDMIDAAKNNNEKLFQELWDNGDQNNHGDVLTPVVHILPKEITMTHLGTDKFLPYVMAVYKGDKKTIDQAKLEYLENPAEKDSITLLHLITFYEYPIPNADLSIAELLLAQDLRLLNAQDFTGATPLFYAAYSNNIEMFKYLLSFKEIKLHLRNKDNLTPCIVAIRYGHRKIMDLVFNHYGLPTEEFSQKKYHNKNLRNKKCH